MKEKGLSRTQIVGAVQEFVKFLLNAYQVYVKSLLLRLKDKNQSTVLFKDMLKMIWNKKDLEFLTIIGGLVRWMDEYRFDG